MKERVQALGGRFSIGGRPGGGTRLEVIVPGQDVNFAAGSFGREAR
jgi:signal transduction histidine kinase